MRNRNIKYYPFIGGIIIFISLFIPAAYFEFEFGFMYVHVYIWMWGLIYIESSEGPSSTVFSQDAFFLISSLVCSGLIVFSAMKLIITAQHADDPNADLHKLKNTWRNMSLISIIIPFVWIGITGAWFYGFWNFFSPGLGLFGTIIGGIIALIGSQMRETSYYPQQQQLPQAQPIPQVIAQNIKYCSKCGQQLEHSAKFCRACGSQQ